MSRINAYAACLIASVAGAQVLAQQINWPSSRIAHPKRAVIGPYNAAFLAGSDGLEHVAQGYTAEERLPDASQWTLHAWVKPTALPEGRATIGSIGKPEGGAGWSLALDRGRPVFVAGGTTVFARQAIAAGRWHLLVATSDAGRLRFFVDGRLAGSGRVDSAAPLATVLLGQRQPVGSAFAGLIADFTYQPSLMTGRDIAALYKSVPSEALVRFEDASPSWPLQVKTQYGLSAPQPAWELPVSKAPFSRPVAKPVSSAQPLTSEGDGRYAVNGWRLIEAPRVTADGEVISRPGFDAKGWHAATVPGTVLTTLVDRGVYPDPTVGLNNMAIPEQLARQSYWYRTEFVAPATGAKRLTLTFDGVNYTAQVWVNGMSVGDVKGAFIRGTFDVTGRLRPGERNSVAVLVSPPPNPGIAHEQSLAGGRGDNGGAMMSDGPTFGASEGWDWIPAVRDRNTGIWQGVHLAATGAVTIGDPAISTRLPRPDNAIAEVSIDVPVTNHGITAATTVVRAAFDDVAVERSVTVAPGATEVVRFVPKDHPQLAVSKPRLWWPNGYGDPALHRLQLTSRVNNDITDNRSLDFGMRTVTYELGSLDSEGALRRVLIDPDLAHRLRTPIVDERHPALRKVRGGWANSLMSGAESSPAVKTLPDDPLGTQMVLRVNGVRIAARGGNWGMDDMMKRVAPERLDPYFRLHREAGMNIIRNWMGQSTEEAFYALADRHGLMVLNDFWESTQDNDAEAQDVPLFVANARDVVRRYRTHPSIVLWFGRNEGVPQPALQTALQDMIWQEDGSRLYKGNSRIINLGGSGPYEWHPPEDYFTSYPHGFAVEVGTSSFPTLESWQRTAPAADRWPISDTWVYHDWHQERGVSMASFMSAMDKEFGTPRDLVDFERKAQMLNYESYRAIFEGFNAGLWTTNSARMLWMTHPAWPSTDFQIYSSDYDTHAAFYGTRKGAEPVHVQMNQPDRNVVMVNTTLNPLTGVKVTARVTDLSGTLLLSQEQVLNVPAGRVTPAFPLEIKDAVAKGPVLIRLEAVGADGQRLSDNFYWQAAKPEDLRALDAVPKATLAVTSAPQAGAGTERTIAVDLANTGSAPALQTKITLFDAKGEQILPAYFSDNYVSLLPGENRRVTVRYPQDRGVATVRVRGWNVPDREVSGTGR
ncbi:Glycosyl hydrolases family 2, sugar binding domain [Sphingomonas gellani]|uniref:Glycosyl hydrolases family 2, sugar binding domain n=1 Tax=Sphingomonas gellani TaxID=1166340 RepID=A0A1H8B1V9_9SPHN|nr:LamG-like jellyroll fold domain-containing protein [Sphingomonas gellani]SEM75787.1 Glycosyl hydrolases family 2, sugar binding domain [Sphingomonas gellani]